MNGIILFIRNTIQSREVKPAAPVARGTRESGSLFAVLGKRLVFFVPAS